MSDNPSQEIYTKLSKFYEREIAGCSCGGSGVSETILECLDGCNKAVRIPTFKRFNTKCSCGKGTLYITKYEECPICAPLRERLKECSGNPRCVAFPYKKKTLCMSMPCETCDSYCPFFPDLTTHLTGSKPTVRVLLEEAGLWDLFDDRYGDTSDLLLLTEGTKDFLQEVLK